MVNFWTIADSVMREADIILLVIDARLVEETKNKEIEYKAKEMKKTLITVINKCDLVNKEELEQYKQKFHPCVFVSAHKFYGITMLRKTILRYAQTVPVSVGVVGYPNTGKSSVINSLKGKASAAVSSVSGYTKGRQNIKVGSKIKIIDTPGVIAESDDKKSVKLSITASKNNKEDPDLIVFELIKNHKDAIIEFYELDKEKIKGFDDEEILEAIAIKRNRFKKGAEPDTQTTAKMILQDWQKGKIKV
ncbi:MAG: GTPase [Candidatus Nanoarchaeia archaeon]